MTNLEALQNSKAQFEKQLRKINNKRADLERRIRNIGKQISDIQVAEWNVAHSTDIQVGTLIPITEFMHDYFWYTFKAAEKRHKTDYAVGANARVYAIHPETDSIIIEHQRWHLSFSGDVIRNALKIPTE